MKTNIQFVSMPTSETMHTYTLKKLERLQRKFGSIIHTDVSFKKGNGHNNRDNICEMEVSLNGPRIFASSHEKTFGLALRKTINDLERQLTKRKGVLKPYA